jgi:Glycosyltransferase family 87
VLACPGLTERGSEDTKLSATNERTIALAGRQVPLVVALGVGALAASWAGIVYFAEPWGRLAGSGMDAICYWLPTLSNPYLNSNWNDQIAYPYSPAFLQLLEPIRVLPWQVFMAVWAAILMAAMTYLTGPRLILLGLAFFGLMEIWGGNIELLVALAIVLGFRWPAAWSFVLLTKITPGIGLLWFAVRREWRSLTIAAAATAAVVAGSFVLMPDAWRAWPQVLASNVGKNGTWAAVPVPFAVRLPFAVALVVWGARTDHRWTVPVSAMLALPALWYGGLSIMLATLPLVGARSWSDVCRIVGQGWAEVEAWATTVRRPGRRRVATDRPARQVR